MSKTFIAVDGCIGVGKTTVARLLADQYGGQSVHESFESMPFLADFYRDPVRYAFQTELFFPLIHYHQILVAMKEAPDDGLVTSDYLFDNGGIFASILLEGRQREEYLFWRLFNHLHERLPRPSLVIYLRAPVPFLMDRIKLRGREVEQGITTEYMQRLSDAYEAFFDRYDDVPVLRLNANEFDVVQDPLSARTVTRQLELFVSPPALHTRLARESLTGDRLAKAIARITESY